MSSTIPSIIKLDVNYVRVRLADDANDAIVAYIILYNIPAIVIQQSVVLNHGQVLDCCILFLQNCVKPTRKMKIYQ